jgi:hypothetical protein
VIDLRRLAPEGLEMNKILIVLFSVITTVSLLAAEGFSSFEEQMTGKEFEAAGLNKLSKQELEALNDWIRRHSLATLDSPKAGTGTAHSADDQGVAKSENKKDDKKEGNERTTITSTIEGKFSGWDGQTVFKLANGMIWAQSDKDKFFTREIENPVVTIEPNMFGKWRLHVEGFDADCRVKRIQ